MKNKPVTNLELLATAIVDGINYRVEYHSDFDLFAVCCADGCGHQWFSTNNDMTDKDDIALALSSYLNADILPCNINYFGVN